MRTILWRFILLVPAYSTRAFRFLHVSFYLEQFWLLYFCSVVGRGISEWYCIAVIDSSVALRGTPVCLLLPFSSAESLFYFKTFDAVHSFRALLLSLVPIPGGSMHLFRNTWLYFVSIAVPSVFIWLHGTRSEGSSLTMEAGGVGSFHLNFNCNPTKLCHGGRSQFDLGRVYGSSTTTQSIKKRSLKRAYRRLQLNGYTWYRGQYWQQVTFPKPPDFIADLTTGSTTNHRCQPSEHLPSNRLVFWHWNSGTLSSTRYQELLRYLHLQKVDVALISEIHWKYNIEWSTQHWHAIHTCSDLSCSSEKASGLLLLIAKRCCQAHQLSWRAIAPGRYPWHLSISLEYLGSSTKSQAIYMGTSPRHSSGISTEEYPMCSWWLQLLTFQASTGWLVPRTFEPRMVVSLDLNMVTWQPLLAYFKTFNLLPWIVGWLPMALHSDPLSNWFYSDEASWCRQYG